MKTTALDFILCGVVLNGLLILAFLVAACVAGNVTTPLLGEYHVLADFCVFLLAYGLLSALALRALNRIRPLELGEFAMDHPNFTYWKLRVMIYEFGKVALKPLTPLPARPLIAAMFGARMGKNIAMGGAIEDPALITVGESSVLGNHSLISGNMTNHGKIFFGTVTIGKNVTIGANSVVMPNVEIGDGAVVGIGSVVLPGTRIPAGESWRGNPARKWQ